MASPRMVRYVPVVGDMKRNHRLDIEDFLRPAMRPDAEIGVALEGNADQVTDRILQLLGQKTYRSETVKLQLKRFGSARS